MRMTPSTVSFGLCLALATGNLACIQESSKSGCAQPGQGSPSSGADLRMVEASVGIETGKLVFRATYFNAGPDPATAVLLPDETLDRMLLAMYLNRDACPPAKEDADYLVELPREIPGEATAQTGLSLDPATIGPGKHNFWMAMDAGNVAWESDEFNNCLGPIEFEL